MQAIQNDDKNGTADYNQLQDSLYYSWATLNKYNTFDLDTPRKYVVLIIVKVAYLTAGPDAILYFSSAVYSLQSCFLSIDFFSSYMPAKNKGYQIR